MSKATIGKTRRTPLALVLAHVRGSANVLLLTPHSSLLTSTA